MARPQKTRNSTTPVTRQTNASQDDKATLSPREGCPEKQDPFGDETNAGVKYKTMAWWQAGMVMIAETISLGILALPKALSTLGLLPYAATILFWSSGRPELTFLPRGILAILGIGIISTYTGYTIGQLKRRYVQIHSMADAGDILFGSLGHRILGSAQLIFFVFVMGGHILTFSIMMNVLTEHSACTMAFSGLGLVVSFVLTLPRRLEDLAHISTVSFISIIGAVLASMIGVSVSPLVPAQLPLFSPTPSVHDACLAIANIVFAYAGHVAFFTFFSELKEINDYPKALALLQVSEMVLYTVTAIVIYAFVGPTVTSPALNSAARLFRRISYGIAIPTIVIGGVVNAHVAVKSIYVRTSRGTNSIHTRTYTARALWAAICAVLWVFSWVIAESIPVFNDVLGLASSLFASWFSFGLPGLFWLHLNRYRLFITWKQLCLFGINIFLVCLGFIICIVGVYSSVRSIFRNLQEGIGGGRFSCEDNSLY